MDELYEEIPQELSCSIVEEAHIDLVEINCETVVPHRDEMWTGPPAAL